MNFIHLLGEPLVVTAVGTTGLNLLRIVVSEEDKHRFLLPAHVTDEYLRPKMGVTETTLIKARNRCIEEGWLHYEPGSQGRASRIWVTIPHWVDEQFRRPDRWRNSAELESRSNSYTELESRSNSYTEDAADRFSSYTDHSTKVSTKTSPSYIPIPVADSSPAPAPTPQETWEEVERVMRHEFNIGDTSEPLRSLKNHGVEPGLALGVLRYASETGAWKPAKIRRRLINLLPGDDPRDRRLWMQPDHGPARSQTAIQAPSDDALREQESRLRQLELVFHDELVSLSMEQVFARYEPPAAVREKLKSYSSYRATDRAPKARLALLEFLEEIRRGKSPNV